MTDHTLWSEAGKTRVCEWLADQFDVSPQVIEKRMDKDGCGRCRWRRGGDRLRSQSVILEPPCSD
jgi:hypothetical protein